MNNKIVNVLVGGAIGLGGFILGSLVQSYKNLKNTPDAVIARLETEKAEAKAAKMAADRSREAEENALAELKVTQEQYKSEVRRELEPKIRKELEDYISKADATYEKAKQERAVTEAKLETMKYLSKHSSDDTIKTLGGLSIWSRE